MLKPGVNVYGYVHAESGVGEHTRLLVSTLKEAGLDYSVIPITRTLSRQQCQFDDFGSGKPEYDINIIGVNADSVSLFLEEFGRSALEGRYTIGLWAWELDEFPDWMAQSADLVDEIWANSSFSGRSIAKKVCRPVQPFPLPIMAPQPPPRTREELDLPEGFLFMFCFDLDSIFARKNPIAVIDAFQLAFSTESGAKLVVKSINGDRHPEHMERIQEAAAAHPDVSYVDGYLPSGDQKAFVASCDAYISLHRAEGFGLTMAEAMALGKPVIATGYSGNLDFMSPENSYLVPFRLAPIGDGNEPYPADGRWAEPDVDAAAHLMRQVFEMPDEARSKVELAQINIAENHSPKARSTFVVQRLERIRQELARRSGGDSRHIPSTAVTSEHEPADTLAGSSDELLKLADDIAGLVALGPDVDAPAAFGGLGKMGRRLALRGVRNLYLYQQEVNQAFLRMSRQLIEKQALETKMADDCPPSQDRGTEVAGNLLAAAQIAEGIAVTCEQRFEGAGDVARDLRLLAARLRGLAS